MKEFDNFPIAGPSWDDSVHNFLTDEELTEFVVTAIAGGGATVVDTVKGGHAQILALATTDDCGAQIQHDAGWVALALSKTLLFDAYAYLTEATSTNVAVESDLWLGFCTIDTSIVASAPTDGIYFQKDDGAATLSLVVRAGGADVLRAATGVSIVAGTAARFSIKVEMDAATANKGTVTFYKDGVSVGSINLTGLPSGIMAKFVAFQTGDGTGTKQCMVDFINVRQQR